MTSVNIVLFGETGVGKSSVINLIAGRPVASVSPDAAGRTLCSTRYNFTVGGRSYNIWDTAGLEQPEMGAVEYMAAIEGVLSLIQELTKQGGLDLLLFCIRGNRVTSTTQSNYRLFYEVLCKQKVPIALAVTNLEREEPNMETWWTRNLPGLEKYGIRAATHACVTGLPTHRRYRESKINVERMLQAYDGQGKYNMPADTWLVEFLRFFGPYARPKKDLKKSDLVKVLTKRCKINPKTAQELADRLTRPKDVDNDPLSAKLPSNSPAQPQGDMSQAPLSESTVVPESSRRATQESDVQQATSASSVHQREPRETAKLPQPSSMRREMSQGIRSSGQQTLLSPYSPSNPPSRTGPPTRVTTEAPAQPHKDPVPGPTRRAAHGSDVQPQPMRSTSGTDQRGPREMAELPRPSSMKREMSEGIRSPGRQTLLSPYSPSNPPSRTGPPTNVTTEAPAQPHKDPVPGPTRRAAYGSDVQPQPMRSTSGMDQRGPREMAELPQPSSMKREMSEGIRSPDRQTPLSPYSPSNPPSRTGPPTNVTTEAPAQPHKEPVPAPIYRSAHGSGVRTVGPPFGTDQKGPREMVELPQLPSMKRGKGEGFHPSSQQPLFHDSNRNPPPRTEPPARTTKDPSTNAATDSKKDTYRARKCWECVLM